MREKLLLHVVEEMTSLSNVFRSLNTVVQEEKVRQIGIRNLICTPETDIEQGTYNRIQSLQNVDRIF